MKPLRTLVLALAVAACCWAAPPKPWHLGVDFEHDFYRGQSLNGANVRFGRDLFWHFALEGNLSGTVRDNLLFSFVGSANQVVFSPGSLDRVRANVLAAAFADLGPIRLTAEAGPELDHLVYQGVTANTFGAFYYGAGIAWYSGDWGFRVQGGDSLFTPVAGAGHAHIWQISVGPSFRW